MEAQVWLLDTPEPVRFDELHKHVWAFATNKVCSRPSSKHSPLRSTLEEIEVSNSHRTSQGVQMHLWLISVFSLCLLQWESHIKRWNLPVDGTEEEKDDSVMISWLKCKRSLTLVHVHCWEQRDYSSWSSRAGFMANICLYSPSLTPQSSLTCRKKNSCEMLMGTLHAEREQICFMLWKHDLINTQFPR